MERADDAYTKDGTTDINKAPANKKKTGTWKACFFILGEEISERLAYFGTSANLVNYLHQMLGLNNAAASKVVTNFQGTCYVTPLLGAFLADAYLGRYWTIAIFSIIYIMGTTLLTMSASIVGIKPSCHNGICHPTELEKTTFYIAIYLIALGTGGIKPCVSSFGADQFDDNDEIEKRRKSSFFNWFYLSINIGSLIASSVLVWIQTSVGWGWGFGIPAVAMAIALMFFFAGTRFYRLQMPGGSPLIRMLQVLVASMRKWDVKPPADKSLLYETANEESSIKGSRKLAHTDKFSFLDKSSVETARDKVNGSVNPWRLCTVTQVEEIKSIIRLLPVWACCIIFTTAYSQMNTTFVLQGNTMDRHMGGHFKIPSASLTVFETISVILWVLIYDQLIIPFARKYTGHARGFTQLQRIGIGLVISILSMVAAGVVEVVRLDYIKQKGYYDVKTIPMSIFWQVPQYIFIGCAGVFTLIGQVEFFYDQAPDAMRSLCSALLLMAAALGSYLSSFLVTIVTRNKKFGWITENLNKGHLDYFFWLLVILSIINFMVFLLVSRLYVYKKVIH
ncbi:hypothetical protein R3W88_024097 [Solanum pinnatisectum]|uniref:Peptide transporter n=1 Tax=Solanum pinnatisectum TaxID=50273 RepID=A0AAV9LZG1_9SOLN|nr:hypothetical protein R3W88_024097 [Solanum pinnatisectum]